MHHPFILVDGSSYLYRAFHALPPLMTSKGQPTGAAYGVLNMIRKLINDYQPSHMAVVFDAKGETFREQLYREYKATRPPMPEELVKQIEPLHAVIKAMGIPLLVVEGVEADDVIGTLAKQASQAGHPVLISTGDKDLAQLVDNKVTLINTMNNTLLDDEGVKKKFGVSPSQIVDYLALIGDKVDNVPGVPNVGPKTAEKWLSHYATLSDVIAHADEIKGKVGDNLRANLDALKLSQRLVTIKTDVELSATPEQLEIKPADRDQLIEYFKQLEFKKWLEEQLSSGCRHETVQENNATHYETIETPEQLEQWIKAIKTADYIAIDTETTSLDVISAELVGISLAITPHQAVYIPLAHDEGEQLNRDDVLKKLKPLLEDPTIKKLGHNLKYDKNVLMNYQIDLKGIFYDSMLESYVLNSSASQHNLDTLALKYLGYKTVHFEDIAGKGAKQKTFNQIPIKTAAFYAAEDADITLQLHQTLYPKIQQESGLSYIYQEIEIPLLSVLARMEYNGILLDKDKLHKQSQVLEKQIEKITAQVYNLSQEEFNLDSPKQLQAILFEKLGLPVLAKTPTGQPSTAESVLSDLALEFELANLILKYRTLSKLKNTYTDKLPLQINSKTGRVHTSFQQAVTATGRLSSSDPNLQNIPVRTEEGRKIRQAFIAPSGFSMIASDYSQIELRIMAHLSQDKSLIKAFEENRDIHRATASEVFGIPEDNVTAENRRHAKAINFGLIYGMSAYGLAKQINADKSVAKEYMDLYFKRYPGVKEYMESTRENAAKKGYVETIFGRRLYLPDIKSSNHMRRMAAERAAINAPMQGSAADIIKRAMIELDQWIQQQDFAVKLILQVHDELVCEVPNEYLEITQENIKRIMETTTKLSVPLSVGIGHGCNWEEAH